MHSNLSQDLLYLIHIILNNILDHQPIDYTLISSHATNVMKKQLTVQLNIIKPQIRHRLIKRCDLNQTSRNPPKQPLRHEKFTIPRINPLHIKRNQKSKLMPHNALSICKQNHLFRRRRIEDKVPLNSALAKHPCLGRPGNHILPAAGPGHVIAGMDCQTGCKAVFFVLVYGGVADADYQGGCQGG